MISRFALAAALVLTLAPLSARAAIVNTLRGFDADKPGWSGSLSGSYGASGGNTEVTKLEAAAQLQWRSMTERVRLMGSAKRASTQGDEIARAVTGHLRHNHHLGGRWSTLEFLQVQENPFQRLKSRALAGVGAQCDVMQGSSATVTAGASHMFERQRLDDVEGYTDAQRLSSFVSLLARVRPGVRLDGVAFYQPRWSEFADWRGFGKLDLNVALSSALTLFTGVQVEHNARPAAGVKETDWETTTGVKVGF